MPSNPARRDLLRIGGSAGIGGLVFAQSVGWAQPGNAITPHSDYAAAHQEAQTVAQDILRQGSATCLGIALATRERIVWAESFGLADLQARRPPDATTMFGVGSTSKMFATIAVMQLVDRGLVNLDEPLVRYVPEFRMADSRYTEITVRMLLNHASGLPGSNYRNIFTFKPVPGYAADVFAALAHERLKATPGFMNVYCNDGFTLVEVLVRAVTGKSFAAYVQASILDPLGMKHSAYTTTPFPKDRYARVYRSGVLQLQEFVGAQASGGLYTTPTDLATFARVFLNAGAYGAERLISSSSVEAMATDQTTGTFNPVKWLGMANGLGWDTVIEPGLNAVGIAAWTKGGDTEFYGAEMMIAPGEGLAVVVLGTQGKGYNHSAAAQRILLRALAETRRIAAFPQPLAPVAANPAKAPDGLTASLAGYFANYESMYQLRPDTHDSLTLLEWGSAGFEPMAPGLRYRADGWFTSDAEPLNSYKVVTTTQGDFLAARTAMGAKHYLDELAIAQRLPTSGAPLAEAWKNRVDAIWLIVNESAYSEHLRPDTNPRFSISVLPQLPGLLVARPALGASPQVVDPSAGATTARMMLTIPGATGRDLHDLDIVVVDGDEWVRWGDWLHRPAATVPVLASASRASVVIGARGYTEWCAVLAHDVPVRISVEGATACRFYNQDFKPLGDGDADHEATLAAGAGRAYLALFGNPGDQIGINFG